MRKISMTPVQTLVTGFVALTAGGAGLLTLPCSSSRAMPTPFIDALFTAVSAVTTTGLVVVDTGSYFSFFGQMVILLLFQVGGLGYMVFIALIVLGLGKKLSLGNRILLHESIARPTSLDIRKFVKVVVLFTLIFELAGAIMLGIFWSAHYSWPQAIYFGVFHAISGFCTAGFALFSDSFCAWRGDPYFNFINAVICTAGGVGFFVLYDMYVRVKKSVRREHPRSFFVYTKFVLFMTVLLISAGTLVVLAAEHWPGSFSWKDRILASFFQVMSASTTTGFNSIDIGTMAPASLITIVFLMFVGASPGSTGGGVKTTTFGLVTLFLVSFFKGREDVHLYGRRVAHVVISKAFAIGLLAFLWMMGVSFLMTATEDAPFLNILFEVASALGTTGLSMGLTPSLSFAGKVLISLTMFIGRIGPIAIGYSLVGRLRPLNYKPSTAEILVG